MKARFLPILFVALALPLWASQGQKKVLDHSIYDKWRTISSTAFSRNGEWLLYRIAPAVGDGVVTVRNTGMGSELKIERGSLPRFTYDGKYVLATILPAKAEVDQAKKAKKAAKDMPKNALGILDLSSGKLTAIDAVKSWRSAEKGSTWISYSVDDSSATPAAGPGRPVGAKPPATVAPSEPKPEEPKEPQKPQKKKDHAAGAEIVLRNISTGEEKKIADVAEQAFSENGSTLAYSISTKTGEGDALYLLDLKSGQTTEVMKGMGRYSQLGFHKSGKLGFFSDRDDYASDQPSNRLYILDAGAKAPKELAKEGSDGLRKGYWIARTSLRFSDDGKRIFFSTQPKPEPEPKDATPVPDDERVDVDIWHYKDPAIQPQQLLQATADRNRTYDAMADLTSGKIVQLEDAELPNVTVADKGNGAVALALTGVPYRVESTWAPGTTDLFQIEVGTGQRKKLVERFEGNASLSPLGQYILIYDSKRRSWTAENAKSGAQAAISQGIPFPVYNELSDTPDDAGPYGSAGWLEGDKGVLIYDRFDIWLCDPEGKVKPVCITDGAGRTRDTTLRAVVLDRSQTSWKADSPLLLAARNIDTEDTGFYRDRLGSTDTPTKLIFGDKLYSASVKAEEADKVVITCADFDEFPDLCLTDTSFKDPKKITDANPEKSQYNWGKTELVEWTSLNGDRLHGILVKPEDFDPGKKYPMIVYFYERLSQTLHSFHNPTPSASTINPSMYASNGYLVFMPDIVYKEGYPGASAEACILPGVTSLIARGYVDEKHIGIQGQSWGGYQVAHLVTRSNMFAAACAGAPVVDMFSAYGGIRWGSGVLRQMQYEQGQSRIGGSIWEKPLQFIENSPLFWADRVTTPLLMMNNDKDGAVPWYQGIEFYSALRRFQKPVWLVVYNGEDHNLTQTKNKKDWSIRLQQFFDHFLKGAPEPVWLAEGIPAVKKGKTYGFDLVPGSGGKG